MELYTYTCTTVHRFPYSVQSDASPEHGGLIDDVPAWHDAKKVDRVSRPRHAEIDLGPGGVGASPTRQWLNNIDRQPIGEYCFAAEMHACVRL